MRHTARHRAKLIARVRRLRGRMKAIERALEADAQCGHGLNLVASVREDHHHGPGHDHAKGHGHHGDDNNLRAAYLPVLADALTSVLAMVALLVGSGWGWPWLDPAMGLFGALVIARRSWGLIRGAGGVLLDYVPTTEDLPVDIRQVIESGADRITDLHVWHLVSAIAERSSRSPPQTPRRHRTPAPSSPTSTTRLTSRHEVEPGVA